MSRVITCEYNYYLSLFKNDRQVYLHIMLCECLSIWYIERRHVIHNQQHEDYYIKDNVNRFFGMFLHLCVCLLQYVVGD